MDGGADLKLMIEISCEADNLRSTSNGYIATRTPPFTT